MKKGILTRLRTNVLTPDDLDEFKNNSASLQEFPKLFKPQTRFSYELKIVIL